MKIRVMSFNIRYANGDLGKKNEWKNRKQSVIDIINKYSPDIVGCQEVLHRQLEFLTENLPEYEFYGVGRRDGNKRGEYNPVFYKKLNLDKKGTFWLSGTHDECSNTWNGGSYRLCTWLKFRESPKFTFFNTHFDNRKREVRNKSSNLMLNRMKQIAKNEPVILTGDFNCSRWSKAYKILDNELTDSFKKHVNNKVRGILTFHNFTGKTNYLLPLYPKVTIDYIWTKKWKIRNSKIIYDAPDAENGIYPSDHWPVLTDLESITSETKNNEIL